LQSLPDNIDQYKHAEIVQAYISVDPTIRLRRSDNNYFLTVKQSGLLAREETEFALTKSQFDHLWEKIETNTVRKTRFFIPLQDGLTAEADIYYDDLQGLMTVEVEFSDTEQAKHFDPPHWFGTDVTYDPNYKNSMLAINGIRLISNSNK